ncbi:MAG: methyltransferase domain-containing protein [Magnetococcales bacterium]|nr:methyltransferase domain-containing protein [Magnetococcales bacterium]
MDTCNGPDSPAPTSPTPNRASPACMPDTLAQNSLAPNQAGATCAFNAVNAMEQNAPAPDQVNALRLRRAMAQAHDPGPLPHIASALNARLDDLRIQPGRILDLGGRTGTLAGLLQKRWPEARLIRIGLEPVTVRRSNRPAGLQPAGTGHGVSPALAADLARLPLVQASFDLVVSNMALHWCGDPLAIFREVHRILRPEGVFLFTTIGSETLIELRHALAGLDRQRHGRIWPRVLAAPDLRQLGDALSASGLAIPVVDRELHHLVLPSVTALLAQLRALGSGNHHHTRHPGLTGKGFVAALDKIYHQLYPNPTRDVQATLEIYFGHAWRLERA